MSTKMNNFTEEKIEGSNNNKKDNDVSSLSPNASNGFTRETDEFYVERTKLRQKSRALPFPATFHLAPPFSRSF